MGKTLWHNWIGGYYIERYITTSGIERIGIHLCILFNRAWYISNKMCAMRIIEEYMYTMAEVCLDLFERNKRDENSIDPVRTFWPNFRAICFSSGHAHAVTRTRLKPFKTVCPILCKPCSSFKAPLRYSNSLSLIQLATSFIMPSLPRSSFSPLFLLPTLLLSLSPSYTSPPFSRSPFLRLSLLLTS